MCVRMNVFGAPYMYVQTCACQLSTEYLPLGYIGNRLSVRLSLCGLSRSAKNRQNLEHLNIIQMSLVEVIMPMSISILTIRCRTKERRNESIWSTVLSRCILKWRHLDWSLGRDATGISKLLIDNIRWLIHKEKAVCGRKRTFSVWSWSFIIA